MVAIAPSPQILNLSLCLVLSAQKRSRQLLQETLGELGEYCTEVEGVKAIEHVRKTLDSADLLWFNGELEKIYRPECKKTQKLPYTALAWKQRSLGLVKIVPFRLSEAEIPILDELLELEGLSQSDLMRKILKFYAEHKGVTKNGKQKKGSSRS